MAEQDRSQWNAEYIAEGVALITDALARGPTGPYQLQAAIAAIHDEAPTAESTDWRQIEALYELLMELSDNPVVALNRAVAVAMAHGAHAGLDLLDGLATDERIGDDHRFHAVRAHLLEMTGDRAARAGLLPRRGPTSVQPPATAVPPRSRRSPPPRRLSRADRADVEGHDGQERIFPEQLGGRT